ncbi:MAG: hypothetical protein ACRCZD_05810 [Phycicoccus sp.]
MSTRIARLALATLLTAGAGIGATATATAAPTPSGPAGVTAEVFCPYVVNGSNVRVRTAPSTSATIIRFAQRGERGLGSQTTYSGSGLTWRKFGGGFVAAQFLTRVSGVCAT